MHLIQFIVFDYEYVSGDEVDFLYLCKMKGYKLEMLFTLNNSFVLSKDKRLYNLYNF